MTAPEKQRDERPSRDEIREQIDRLECSDALAARRSRQLLSFVVAKALTGRAERLTGYTLGVEVFGRPEDFDPQSDPIVRVEASRLRRRLEHYYLTEGSKDRVLIEVPKGGYTPRFSYRPTAAAPHAPPESAPSPEQSLPRAEQATVRPRRHLATVALGVGLLMLLLAGWSLTRQRLTDGESKAELPIVAMVQPFGYAFSPGTSPHPFLQDGVVDEITLSLANLPGLELIAVGTADQASEQMTLQEMSDFFDLDYLVRGTVRQELDRFRITVSVVETRTSKVRLSKSYDGQIGEVLALQAELASDFADAVALSVDPTVARRLGANAGRDPETVALYHQLTREYRRPWRAPASGGDPQRLQAADETYRRIIELDPTYPDGHAGLAFTLAVKSWWRPGDASEEEARQALEAARTAVLLDPEYGWGQAVLALASTVRGEYEEAITASRRAPLLSPSDPYVLSLSAMAQLFAGVADENTVELARNAVRLDSLSASTPYRNILGMVLFHKGLLEEAHATLAENVERGGPDGAHVASYRVATLAALGRSEEARREWESASKLSNQIDVERFLSVFRDARYAEQVLDLLTGVGFSPERTASLEPTPR